MIRHVSDDHERVEILIRLFGAVVVHEPDRALKAFRLFGFRIAVEVDVAHDAAAQHDVVSFRFGRFFISREDVARNK